MPYNFAADSFHTKKLCSRLSSIEVHFLIKIGRFAFLRPPLGNLGATYVDHLRLIGIHRTALHARMANLSVSVIQNQL